MRPDQQERLIEVLDYTTDLAFGALVRAWRWSIWLPFAIPFVLGFLLGKITS